MANILIIEDDADIREGVRILLESENYTVQEADCGRAGLDILNDEVDLVILDIMMPGMSGLKTCEEIRKVSNVPVLFLTAKTKESDKLIGLMAGGDDYLSKPFSYAELLGRVKALLRRYEVYKGKAESGQDDSSESVIEIGKIRINEKFNEVTVCGKKTELSDIEYHILLLMMQNPHRVFSAQNIYEAVWNEPFFYSSSGTVMVHIRNLRVRIEKDPQNPAYIKTVWGKGYRFE
jgi:DNA-binding response OmpR family regulator